MTGYKDAVTVTAAVEDVLSTGGFDGSPSGIRTLKELVSKTTGDRHRGKRPIVLTRDREGYPKDVRLVEKDRFERLDLVSRIGRSQFSDSVSIAGTSVREGPGGPSDLRMTIKTTKTYRYARRKLSSRICGMPVEVESVDDVPPVAGSVTETSDWTASPTTEEIYSGVPGSSGTYQGESATGTIGLVGFDAVTGDRCCVTAAHVADPSRSNTFTRGLYRNGKIGEYEDHSPFHGVERGWDVAKYRLLSDVTSTLGKTIDSVNGRTPSPNPPLIDGVWTYSGLVDAIADGGQVDGYVVGQSTNVTDVRVHQVGFGDDFITKFRGNGESDTGDSGGAVVDGTGNLIGFVSNVGPGPIVEGAPAEHALNHLDMTLSPPNGTRPIEYCSR